MRKLLLTIGVVLVLAVLCALAGCQSNPADGTDETDTASLTDLPATGAETEDSTLLTTETPTEAVTAGQTEAPTEPETALPGGPSVTVPFHTEEMLLTLVEDFSRETAVSGSADAYWGYGRKTEDGLLISSGAPAGDGTSLAAVYGFGTSTMTGNNFDDAAYIALHIQNLNNDGWTGLYLTFEGFDAAGNSITLGVKHQVDHPLYLVWEDGYIESTTATDALSWSGRVLVHVSANFEGYLLLPVELFAPAWDSAEHSAPDFATFGFFMNGNGDGKTNMDYLLVKGIYKAGRLPDADV